MTAPDHKPERVYAEPMPCPFCGGEGSVNEGRDGAFVHCVDCLASTNILCPHNLSKAEAIEDWNTRVTEPHPQAPASEIGGEVTQARLTMAAGAIIDVMMGGRFDWRDRLDQSDFLESADWLTAMEYARAALATPATERPTDPAIAALREAVEPLLRFHETGGHEGDGSDAQLGSIRNALAQLNPGDHNDR